MRFRVLVGGVFASIAATMLVAAPAAAAPGEVRPPFTLGETWYVYQGYNSGTHAGGFGLDLTVNRANTTSSAGRTVRAPKAGTVLYWQPSTGTLCVNSSDGRSYALTHIDSALGAGAAVTAGQSAGTVAGAGGASNNGVAHLHLGFWSGPGCYGQSTEIPFDSAHQSRLCGAPNMTPSGPSDGNGVWSGTRLDAQPCDSALQPIAGDWNGDGRTDIGLRRVSSGMFYLRTGPSWTQRTVAWEPGRGSDLQPITGDWNGDGRTDVGLRRVSTGMFYFRTGPSWTQTTASWPQGAGYDLQPIAGDWNDDGRTDVGLRRVSSGMFYLRTGPSWTQRTVAWEPGRGNDLQPIAGDWNGDGRTDVGLRRVSSGMFYLRTGPSWTQRTVAWAAGRG